MMKNFFALCLLVMATLSVSAKEIKEFIVTTTPPMSCQNCENKIKKNIRFEKGVTDIRTDLANQIVVVTYDAEKTNEANLTKAFEKINYKVTPATTKGVALGSKAKAGAAKPCAGAQCKALTKDAKGDCTLKKAAGSKAADCKKADGCKGGDCKKAEGCKPADCKKADGCKGGDCKKAEGCKGGDCKKAAGCKNETTAKKVKK